MLKKWCVQANLYGIAVVWVTLATLLTSWLTPLLSTTSFALFYGAVVLTAWKGGLKPGLLAIVLSMLCVNYFFLEPIQSLAIAQPGDTGRLALTALVAYLIVYLTAELRGSRQYVQQLSDRQLQEQEAQLRLALHAADMGMWHWNLESNQIVWSPEHEKLFGLAPGSFDGRFETFNARVYPDDRAGVQQAVQTAIQDRTIYKHEYRIVWFDGSIHWVEGRGQTFYDANDKPIKMTGTIMNIDDRKQAEVALANSEQQLRAIFEAEPECVKVVTIEGDLKTINPAGLAILEADTAEQVLGECVCPFIKAPYQQAFLDLVQQAAQGQTGILEFEMVGLKGTQRWLESHAVPLQLHDQPTPCVLAVTRDITERKQAEVRIQRSEERYRSLVAATFQIVWVADADGNTLTVSPAWQDLTGEVWNQMQPWMWLDYLHPDDRDRAVQAWQTAVTHRATYVTEYRLRAKDGHYRDFWVRGVPVINADGSVREWIGTCTDITERKQAERELNRLNNALEQRVAARTQELERTNKLFNSFFTAASSARIGLCIHDQDLRFVQINEALATMNGVSIAAHLGKTIADIVPALNPTIEPLLQQVLSTGQPILNLEIAAELPNQPDLTRYWLASYFPILGRDAVEAVGVMVVEISDRKQVEATLKENDRRWQFLLDNVQLIVVQLDQDGCVDYVNPFFLDITGYTEAEVLGQPWFERFLPVYLRPQVHLAFQEILKHSFHPHYQNMILTKSGEERVIAWNNTLLRDLQGNSIGTISIGEDITERYKLERMKAEFVSIVSHELRTPLTSINGALELLDSGLLPPNSERGRQSIQIAAREAERLTRLVNDILDLERLESGKVRLESCPHNLADLMIRAVDFMQLAADQAAITLSTVPLAVTLTIDGDRILQVLTNLLSNAIKFSPKGSTIWLTAELQSPPSDAGRSPEVLVTVRDQGRGIPANKLESIFERFQQVDASDSRHKGGTGLGLAICRSIIQQHGGRIWAESILEQGSSFYFTLPLDPDA